MQNCNAVFSFLGANNLIPMEIALKIAEKIKANERFAAYIVIPMWPEGVPTGAATQRILFWQVCSTYKIDNGKLMCRMFASIVRDTSFVTMLL